MDQAVLTPEEQRWIKPLFAQYDLEDSSIVMGERVRPLLEKSGLPPAQLGQIWQIVDTENRGFLDYDGFAKVLRLLYHTQQGLALSPRLANIPSGMPDLTKSAAAAPPTQANVMPPAPTSGQPNQAGHSAANASGAPLRAFSTGGSNFSANGETRIPPLTTADKKRYGALFDRSVQGTADPTYVEGGAARDIFLKARLPEDTLGRVWALIDVDSRGKLTKNEFVVAMHLIQALIAKSMPQLPSQLPANWMPWLGSGHARQTSVQAVSPSGTGQQSSLLGNATGSNMPGSLPSYHAQSGSTSSATPAAAPTASMSISSKDRSQYDAIFDSIDTSRTGILGAGEAVPVLMKSGLSEEVLAKVWDLADTRSRGQLDKGDFALAMHFVKAKLNGQELPESVSPGAGAPPPPATRQASGGAANHAANQAPAPVAPAQPQSSLSDLVSLDNAIFKPLEPKPKKEEPEKKFVPTTSFGQQLLQKQAGTASPSQPSAAPVGSPSAAPAAGAAGAAMGAAVAAGAPAATMTTTTVTSGAPGVSASDIASAQNRVRQQQAHQTKANDELATVLKEKADLESRLAELRLTYDQGTKQVHDAQQETRTAREAIKQLERDIALRTSGMEAIKTQHAQEVAELEALKQQQAELESQTNALSDEKRELEKQHAGHAATVSRLQAEIAQLGDARRQHEQLAKQHREAKTQLEAKAAALTTEHESWSKQKSDWAAEIAKLEAEKREIEAGYAQQQSALDAAKAEAANHESRHAALQQEVETARWRRQQLIDETAQHQARADHARGSAEALSREVRNDSASSMGGAPIAVAALGGAGLVGGPMVGGAPLGAPLGTGFDRRSTSTDSAATSITAPRTTGNDTPRTTPPTSEANFVAVESSMPTFTLPMQRPHSASSSVMNNPPQSVRGDLGSEPSERPTPEFPPLGGSGDPAVPDLDLRRENSLEFVDAKDRPHVDSSDDEGPDAAIPQRYGDRMPAMPGAFPGGSEPTETEPAHVLGHPAVTESPHAQDGQHIAQHPEQSSSQTGVPVPGDLQTSIPAPTQLPTQGTGPVPPSYGAATTYHQEGFDDFDDLEDAQVDEGDDMYAAETRDAGPDEWQQLFARNNESVVSLASGPNVAPVNHVATSQPVTQPVLFQGIPQGFVSSPQESRELAELTSMGFTVEEARRALEMHNHNLTEATNYLLDNVR